MPAVEDLIVLKAAAFRNVDHVALVQAQHNPGLDIELVLSRLRQIVEIRGDLDRLEETRKLLGGSLSYLVRR